MVSKVFFPTDSESNDRLALSFIRIQQNAEGLLKTLQIHEEFALFAKLYVRHVASRVFLLNRFRIRCKISI